MSKKNIAHKPNSPHVRNRRTTHFNKSTVRQLDPWTSSHRFQDGATLERETPAFAAGIASPVMPPATNTQGRRGHRQIHQTCTAQDTNQMYAMMPKITSNFQAELVQHIYTWINYHLEDLLCTFQKI